MLPSQTLTDYQKTAGELGAMLEQARVDHIAFDQLLQPCAMVRCKGMCCYDGVYLSDEEKEKVEQLAMLHTNTFESYGLDLSAGAVEAAPSGRGGRSGARWKTRARQARCEEQAEDFPEHFAQTRCVFLDENSHCGLQRLAMDEGKHPWFYKPLTCWIHPIVIQSTYGEEPVIRIVTKENDPQRKEGYPGYASCTHCGRFTSDGEPAYQVLQQELEGLGHLSGRDFLAELTAPKMDYEEVFRD